MKHARLIVHVPVIGRYCLIGKDLPEADVDIVQGAVAAINKLLHNVLGLEVTDHA